MPCSKTPAVGSIKIVVITPVTHLNQRRLPGLDVPICEKQIGVFQPAAVRMRFVGLGRVRAVEVCASVRKYWLSQGHGIRLARWPRIHTRRGSWGNRKESIRPIRTATGTRVAGVTHMWHPRRVELT